MNLSHIKLTEDLFLSDLARPNSDSSNHHPSAVCVSVCVCTTLYRTQFLMHMLHMQHIYTHTSPYIHVKYLAYMPSLVGIFVHATYLTITSKVEITGGCFLAY